MEDKDDKGARSTRRTRRTRRPRGTRRPRRARTLNICYLYFNLIVCNKIAYNIFVLVGHT